MKCERCGQNEATVFYRIIINGEAGRHALCSHCAGSELFSGIGEGFLSETSLLDSLISSTGFSDLSSEESASAMNSVSDSAVADGKDSPDDEDAETSGQSEYPDLGALLLLSSLLHSDYSSDSSTLFDRLKVRQDTKTDAASAEDQQAAVSNSTVSGGAQSVDAKFDVVKSGVINSDDASSVGAASGAARLENANSNDAVLGAAKFDGANLDVSKSDSAASGGTKSVDAKFDDVKSDGESTDAVKSDSAKSDSAKSSVINSGSANSEVPAKTTVSPYAVEDYSNTDGEKTAAAETEPHADGNKPYAAQDKPYTVGAESNTDDVKHNAAGDVPPAAEADSDSESDEDAAKFFSQLSPLRELIRVMFPEPGDRCIIRISSRSVEPKDVADMEGAEDKIPEDAGIEVRRLREMEALREQMNLAVSEERYEDAIVYRDRLKSLQEEDAHTPSENTLPTERHSDTI